MIDKTPFVFHVIRYCTEKNFGGRRAEAYPLLNEHERAIFKTATLAFAYEAGPKAFQRLLTSSRAYNIPTTEAEAMQLINQTKTNSLFFNMFWPMIEAANELAKQNKESST